MYQSIDVSWYMAKVCWVCGGAIPEKIIKRLGTPIAELGCSARLNNALMRGGFEYVEQVIKLDSADLLRLRNFGKCCLNELTKKLNAFGFDWQN
jgi:DNA-directed RNA polymerase alpha subunit